MRIFKNLSAVLFALSVFIFIISCKPSEKKELIPEEFLKIENEVLTSDMTPEAKEAAAVKHGYTLKQYKEFEEKIEKDPELKSKMGELRLNAQKTKEMEKPEGGK